MTRGNQRDLAREKAAKKAGKGKQEDTAANAGLTVEVKIIPNIYFSYRVSHIEVYKVNWL